MRDLTESRARIVAAGDAERRRIERNLHDGAQQRLVTVSLHLHLSAGGSRPTRTGARAARGRPGRADARARGDPRARPRPAPARPHRPRPRRRAFEALAERALLPVELVELPGRAAPARGRGCRVLRRRRGARERGQARQRLVRHASASRRRSDDRVVEVSDDGVGGADPRGLRPARPRRPRRGARRACSRSRASRVRHRAAGRAARTTEPTPRAHESEDVRPRPTAERLCSTTHPEVGIRIARPCRTSPGWWASCSCSSGSPASSPASRRTSTTGLEFAGDDGNAELLGIFQVSVLHNLVHVLFGIAGLALAATASGARTFLIGGGAIYLVLWLLGLVGGADWIPSNNADDWLHLGLGLGMIARGRRARRASGRSRARPEPARRSVRGRTAHARPLASTRRNPSHEWS